MYSKTVKGGGHAKSLIDAPIKIYSNPEIDWHVMEKQIDFYDINDVDQTAIINELRRSINKDAELINAWDH